MEAKERGVASEVCVIDGNQTGHPTVGPRSREQFLGGADSCLVIQQASRVVREARGPGLRPTGIPVRKLPTYGFEDVEAIPRPASG